MPSPAVYCTGGAARTRRLRLGPMGYIPFLYNPLRIVEEAAVLDQVLHGRLELGLVSGILPDYFVPYKADFHSRRQVTYEAVLLLKAAFSTEGPFSFAGQFYQYGEREAVRQAATKALRAALGAVAGLRHVGLSGQGGRAHGVSAVRAAGRGSSAVP